MPPLAPAGSMGRPALPVAELDERAWVATVKIIYTTLRDVTRHCGG